MFHLPKKAPWPEWLHASIVLMLLHMQHIFLMFSIGLISKFLHLNVFWSPAQIPNVCHFKPVSAFWGGVLDVCLFIAALLMHVLLTLQVHIVNDIYGWEMFSVGWTITHYKASTIDHTVNHSSKRYLWLEDVFSWLDYYPFWSFYNWSYCGDGM